MLLAGPDDNELWRYKLRGKRYRNGALQGCVIGLEGNATVYNFCLSNSFWQSHRVMWQTVLMMNFYHRTSVCHEYTFLAEIHI